MYLQGSRGGGSEVAVKRIDRSGLEGEDLEMLNGEVDIMMRLQHKNCLTILEVYRDEGKASVWDLVLPIMRGGELYEKVKHGPLPEPQARHLLLQVNAAMGYLHSKGIVHRDLKPENVMFEAENSPTICLADFGAAGTLELKQGEQVVGAAPVYDDNCLDTIVGTAGYISPEVVDLMYGNEEGYGRPSDMWSFGVLAHLVLSGKLPYDQQEVDDPVPEFDLEALMEGTGPNAAAESDPAMVEKWGGISKVAKEIVRLALDREPGQRATAETLAGHAWFADSPRGGAPGAGNPTAQ